VLLPEAVAMATPGADDMAATVLNPLAEAENLASAENEDAIALEPTALAVPLANAEDVAETELEPAAEVENFASAERLAATALLPDADAENLAVASNAPATVLDPEERAVDVASAEKLAETVLLPDALAVDGGTVESKSIGCRIRSMSVPDQRGAVSKWISRGKRNVPLVGEIPLNKHSLLIS
jgi:hypothetical protein